MPKAKENGNGRGWAKDACCVKTKQLAPWINEWIRMWTANHPDLAARAAAGGARQNELGQFEGRSDVVGAVTILAERTRMLNGGLGVRGGRGISVATIRNVIKARNPNTELWVADGLLCACGITGVLRRRGDGAPRVPVRKSPSGRLGPIWIEQSGTNEDCFACDEEEGPPLPKARPRSL